MSIRTPLLSTLILAGTMFGLSACASSSDVPDDGSKKSPNYRSTQPSASSEKSSEKASKSAENTGEASSGKQSVGTRGGSKGIPRAVGPVAHVDGDPIPAETFNDELEKVAKTGKFPKSLLHKFKKRLIERLIDQRLVDNAIEQSSIEVTDKEVEQKLEEVRSEFDKAAEESDGNIPSLEQAAEQYGISDEELRDSIRRSLAIEKLMIENGLEPPGDKAVKAFYEKHKEKFRQPEQVHTRHILAKVSPNASDEKWKKAKKRIQKIRKKVVSDGAGFADWAKKKSDGPSAKNGGDIGFIGRKDFDKNFTKAAFDLEKGEISQPVRTKYGWHLIKLVERRNARTVPFEEVEARLHKRLKNRRIKKKLQTFVEKLRREAEIKKHPDNVK